MSLQSLLRFFVSTMAYEYATQRGRDEREGKGKDRTGWDGKERKGKTDNLNSPVFSHHQKNNNNNNMVTIVVIVEPRGHT